MLFVEPPQTRYDLHFSVLGIPVRVHPLFWLICLLLGGTRDVGGALRWVGVVFVSILIHELGHALVARSYGAQTWITLYGFGGLASYRGIRADTRTSIGISFAGPMAGFLFAAVIAAAIVVSGHEFDFLWWKIGDGKPIFNATLYLTIYDLFFVNIFWGLVNLLPVFPLDGGRISMALLEAANPREGTAQALWLSVVAALAAAGAAFIYLGSPLVAIFFGYMAYSSYAMMGGGFGRRW